MNDAYGRRIDYLRLSVTDLCNYRCIYCMPDSGVPKKEHSEVLSVEECIDVAAQSARCGVRKVRVTGGEPLVRHGILDICRGIAEIGGIAELCLTTNGSLLGGLARSLREAGVDRLNVSLDTLRPERFASLTRRGSLTDVLEGVDAALRAGFGRLKFNVVLMGGVNDDEIPDFVALTRERPVEVRFIELMPIGECADWDRSRFIGGSRVLEACPDLRPTDTDGVAARYRIPGYAGTVGLIRPLSHKFCSECNRIRVTADGKLKPCLHSEAEIPLKGLRGEALFRAIRGGILQKPLQHEMERLGSRSVRPMNRIGG